VLEGVEGDKNGISAVVCLCFLRHGSCVDLLGLHALSTNDGSLEFWARRHP
jgi:hypothetical protein